MRKCLRCDSDLVEDLSVYAQGVYRVELSKGKRISSEGRCGVKAAVCPVCGDVSLTADPSELARILRD